MAYKDSGSQHNPNQRPRYNRAHYRRALVYSMRRYGRFRNDGLRVGESFISRFWEAWRLRRKRQQRSSEEMFFFYLLVNLFHSVFIYSLIKLVYFFFSTLFFPFFLFYSICTEFFFLISLPFYLLGLSFGPALAYWKTLLRDLPSILCLAFLSCCVS